MLVLSARPRRGNADGEMQLSLFLFLLFFVYLINRVPVRAPIFLICFCLCGTRTFADADDGKDETAKGPINPIIDSRAVPHGLSWTALTRASASSTRQLHLTINAFFWVCGEGYGNFSSASAEWKFWVQLHLSAWTSECPACSKYDGCTVTQRVM